LEALTVAEKSRNEFVTQVDEAAEAAIIEVIRDHYPEHSILAEESGASGGEHEYQWIIDPLDGTTNYVHGFPVFSVSIAVARAGDPRGRRKDQRLPRHGRLSRQRQRRRGKSEGLRGALEAARAVHGRRGVSARATLKNLRRLPRQRQRRAQRRPRPRRRVDCERAAERARAFAHA